jgi:hypothetical protein
LVILPIELYFFAMKHFLRSGLFLLMIAGPFSKAFCEIPKIMPDDFRIYYQSHIGYDPTYRSIDLSIKECSAVAEPTKDLGLTTYSFTINEKELSYLYDALLALKAFTLKSKASKNSNRGGEKIEYTIAGKKYIVNNEGLYFIIPAHVNHFMESIDLITGCANRYRH